MLQNSSETVTSFCQLAHGFIKKKKKKDFTVREVDGFSYML